MADQKTGVPSSEVQWEGDQTLAGRPNGAGPGQLLQWEVIFQAIGHPTLILDPDHKIIHANEAAQDLSGLNLGELCTRKCFEIFHSASEAPHDCPLDTAIKGGAYESVDMEMEAVGRIFLVSCTPVLDQAGAVEYIIHIATDITERKETEAMLAASESRYRAYIQGSPLPIMVYDATGRFIEVNQADCESTGYAEDELLGKTIPELWAPEYTRQAARIWGQYKATGQAKGEILYRVKEGARRWMLLNAIMLPDGTGLAMTQDTTERREAAQERERLEGQLQQSQKMEAIGRLAGGVAHDFNNTLTAISGFAGILLEEMDEADPRRLDVEEITRAAQSAAVLTQQLLAFSRKQLISPRVINLNGMIRHSRKMLTRLIGEDVVLQFRPGEGLWRVRLDPGQVDQVLVNLAINARDAMPDGGRLVMTTRNITVRDRSTGLGAIPRGEYVLFSVRDTGHGMDQETRARVFEPFFTTKPQSKGTGLGLSTVYGIVTQNHGHIRVLSQPGDGATFQIHFPRETRSDTEEVKEVQELQKGDETLLLVEDQEQVRTLSKRILERAGYRVLCAESGPAALDLVGEDIDQIHLLVTDVVMPGMSGKELHDRLILLRPGLQALFMSGYTEDTIANHGVLDPGTDFLPKPFTAEELTSKVREVLDRQDSGAE